MSLDTINRYALAMDLLSLDARISIVVKETGLSAGILRKAYVDMHHRSPASGSLKTSPHFIYKSHLRTKEATVYAVYFRIQNVDEFCQRTITSYRRYSSYIKSVSRSEPVLDFSEAWVISKWLTSGTLKLVRCGHCRSAKLLIDEQQYYVCCVCKT